MAAVIGMGFEPEDAEAAEITNVGFSAHSYNDFLSVTSAAFSPLSTQSLPAARLHGQGRVSDKVTTGGWTARAGGWSPTWGRSRTGTWHSRSHGLATIRGRYGDQRHIKVRFVSVIVPEIISLLSS